MASKHLKISKAVFATGGLVADAAYIRERCGAAFHDSMGNDIVGKIEREKMTSFCQSIKFDFKVTAENKDFLCNQVNPEDFHDLQRDVAAQVKNALMGYHNLDEANEKDALRIDHFDLVDAKNMCQESLPVLGLYVHYYFTKDQFNDPNDFMSKLPAVWPASIPLAGPTGILSRLSREVADEDPQAQKATTNLVTEPANRRGGKKNDGKSKCQTFAESVGGAMTLNLCKLGSTNVTNDSEWEKTCTYTVRKVTNWTSLNFLNAIEEHNQTGRVFSDPKESRQCKHEIGEATSLRKRRLNLNVRGLRGNISQTYPATEYDFHPVDLVVGSNDLVHVQWTGNDNTGMTTNNNGEGTNNEDRHNIVQLG